MVNEMWEHQGAVVKLKLADGTMKNAVVGQLKVDKVAGEYCRLFINVNGTRFSREIGASVIRNAVEYGSPISIPQ